MLRTIRRSIFETNSSSTHGISIAAKNDYDRWKNGECLFDGSNFISREDAINEIKEDKWFVEHYPNFDFSDENDINKILREYDYYTYDKYGYDYEFFSKSHKTQMEMK